MLSRLFSGPDALRRLAFAWPLLVPTAHASAQLIWEAGSPTAPVPRSDAQMVFDSARGTLLLTGGWNGTRDLDEVWSFDGSRWSRLQPTTSPGAHSAHCLAFDSARDRAVLFGGFDPTGLRPATTWEWDGLDWALVQTTTAPAPRAAAAMAFDPNRRRVVLFGGNCGRGCALDDTWEWDGTSWTRMQSATAPSPRYSAAFGYDPTTRRMLLFGGRTLTARVDDTWSYGQDGWRRLSPSRSPTPRSAAALTTDSTRNRVTLFGGFAGTYLNDTWDFDGVDWIRRAPTGSTPPARAFAAIAHDEARGVTRLVGGAVTGTLRADSFALRAATAAAATRFGVGCPTAAPPELRTADGARPWIGDLLQFRLLGSLAGAFLQPVLWLGDSDQRWRGSSLPVDLSAAGLPGCSLLIAPQVATPMTVAPNGGAATASIPLPLDTALLGAQAFAQASDVNNSPSGGLRLSDALRLRIGGR